MDANFFAAIISEILQRPAALLTKVLSVIDHAILAILTPLVWAILISGIDDMIINAAWALEWLKTKVRPVASLFPPGPRQLNSAPRKRIAILVPLWQEHQVIARMLEHNIAAIRYRDYHIFAGAYPNDDRTQHAVRSACERFANIHLVLCPHDGPTSKADCLNWIYQHLCLWEEQHGQRFDIVMTHDAEDLVHPDELLWINYYAARYDFIQTPVLALPTPLFDLTHGVYCDEFAENHSRDMRVRAVLGGFVPGAGVGTAYRREALDRLAEAEANRIFEPEALTEDYENGWRLFRLGCSQAFVPLVRTARHDFLATREYFPQNWSAALRQRTRWVMGIALQTWQRHGWRGTPGEIYWLWRDRKGLLASPLGFVANLVFLYGAATRLWTRLDPGTVHLAWATMTIALVQIGIRMGCVGRIYGLGFALGVPVRAVYGNVLNSAATVQAIAKFAVARIQGRPLKWVKTDHEFPTRAALLVHKRMLGEILVGSGDLTEAQLTAALQKKPDGLRLGEFLIGNSVAPEDAVYEALSLQQGLPLTEIDEHQVPTAIARALPGRVLRDWRVLPFRVAEGSLFVATPDLPSIEMSTELHRFTSRTIRFHLVTPARFRNLTRALL
jgi:adsorption protein B